MQNYNSRKHPINLQSDIQSKYWINFDDAGKVIAESDQQRGLGYLSQKPVTYSNPNIYPTCCGLF